jgi:hypothetical protein
MSDEDLLVGDDAIHGEAAYAFYDVEDTTSNIVAGETLQSSDPENGGAAKEAAAINPGPNVTAQA